MLGAFSKGFLLSLSLILAIGAQNAFVLRQGIMREHIGAVIAFCAISDAVLILAGVYGASKLIEAIPGIEAIFIGGGALFLLLYAASRFHGALRASHSLRPDQLPASSFRQTLLKCAGFTYLNPHVYLDTFILMGSMALPYEGSAKLAFAIGGAAASLVFFSSLGFGARLLAPLFANARMWRILDAAIGAFMLFLAITLIRTYFYS